MTGNSGANSLSKAQKAAAVCRYLCEGKSPSQIADLMREVHKVEMTREEPYRLVSYAARKNWLRFSAPSDDKLRKNIKTKYDFLQDVQVVDSKDVKDVAERTAETILELIFKFSRDWNRTDVHIGFGGGYSMQLVAKSLADLLLDQDIKELPILHLHALMSGFDTEHPGTDPNTFFSNFDTSEFREKGFNEKIQFVLLHVPPIIKPGLKKTLLKLPGVVDAYKSSRELDVIVTSAGSINDDDSMLNRYHECFRTYSPEMKKQLEDDDCVGDMLWLPISRSGPIDNSGHPLQAMALVDLHDLPRFIGERGTRVVLAIGPCSLCGRSKSDILAAILGLPDPHITHLVVDSNTARTITETAEPPAVNKASQP